jgi:uncharacterized protein
MNAEPLTDSEFDAMSDILNRFASKRAMNVEQLDGFLAAVICCAGKISASEYLPEIWGDDMVTEEAFADQPILKNFLLLVDRHKNATADTLQSGEVFTPLLFAGEDGVFRGNDWAAGFMRGMELRRENWTTLWEDENHAGSLVPILILAHEHDPDPELHPYPISAERRENLLTGVAAGVMNIYKYFRTPQAVEEAIPSLGDLTYRRIIPKIGREPCPCESGETLKHCCGKITLH